MITREELKARFSYCPDTGILRRKSDGRRLGWDLAGYLGVTIDGKNYRIHRLAWLYMTGALPEGQIDHINGVRSDNRFSNLREATNAENSRNGRSRPGTSKYKGVSWFKRDSKWVAHIMKDAKSYNLGYFDDEEDAARAYDAAAVRMFGDFARLNFGG